jgi:uncharacterized protein DUF4260
MHSATLHRRSSAARLLYGLLALSLLAATAVALATTGTGWWQLAAFGLGPDAALLLGAGRGLERGQLHPRAVPLYNALHVLVGPTLLALASLVIGIDWFAGALAWTAHIAIDRALGYRLRDKRGFIRASGS